MHDALVDQLCEELLAYQIPCGRDAASTLVSYLELVIEKNKVLNLTRITTPRDAVTLHLVDSLLPLCISGLGLSETSTLLDMGTGAGFPGVPLMVLTGAKATLVDSVGKKVVAVNEFLERLSLARGEGVHARLEDLALERPNSQTHVIARAVAKANVLIEYATPFLTKDGVLIIEKGRPDEQELREASAAAKICGLEYVSRETFALPRDLGHREILLFKKTGKPSIKLPRRNGLAKTSPLGVH